MLICEVMPILNCLLLVLELKYILLDLSIFIKRKNKIIT